MYHPESSFCTGPAISSEALPACLADRYDPAILNAVPKRVATEPLTSESDGRDIHHRLVAPLATTVLLHALDAMSEQRTGNAGIVAILHAFSLASASSSAR